MVTGQMRSVLNDMGARGAMILHWYDILDPIICKAQQGEEHGTGEIIK